MTRFWKILALGAMVALWGSCASDATRFGAAEVSIVVTRGGQPAAHERLVVWIEEHRLELATDANGRLEITENYPWTAQAFTFPPVGSLGHSPKPIVAVSLADDPGRQFDGVRTAVALPNDIWKMTIRIELTQAP